MGNKSSSGTRAAREVSLEILIHSTAPEELCRAAGDPRLTEEMGLGLLARRDLPSEVLEALARNGTAMKSRKLIQALVAHKMAPRHLSLPLLRQLYSFELMQLAFTPSVAADLKVMADEVIISRLETLSTGERLSLAKRASGRVAAALLRDSEDRIVRAALDNPQLTEAGLLKLLMKPDPPPVLVDVTCRHLKWSLRRDVRIALLRSERTPLAHAVAFSQSLTPKVLRDVLYISRLSDKVKEYLLSELARRERE